MIEEVKEPIQDFTVWLKMKRELEEIYHCSFRLKEDDDDNLTVIFNEESYVNDQAFEAGVLKILKNTFGEEILSRTTFHYAGENDFKVII